MFEFEKACLAGKRNGLMTVGLVVNSEDSLTSQKGHMKSYCKRFKITKQFIISAYETWKLAESGRDNAWRVDKQYGGINNLADEIFNEIQTRTLQFEPIVYTDRLEAGNGKIRHIGQQSAKQQICDYIFITAVEGFLNKRIGFYQVASIKNKGPVFASKMVGRWVQEGGYWTHMDIRHCYQSMDQAVILGILSKYIKSKELIYIAKTLMSTYEEGLNIGSYFSLKISQLVLSFAYHFLEDKHRIRRGRRIKSISHQIWYADDIYLFSRNKRELQRIARSLSAYLSFEFNLHVKPWKVCMCYKEPTDIAGYVCKLYATTIRKKTYLRIRKAYRSYYKSPSLQKARRACSYWGYLKHSDSKYAMKVNDYKALVRSARKYISRYDRRTNERSLSITVQRKTRRGVDGRFCYSRKAVRLAS